MFVADQRSFRKQRVFESKYRRVSRATVDILGGFTVGHNVHGHCRSGRFSGLSIMAQNLRPSQQLNETQIRFFVT